MHFLSSDIYIGCWGVSAAVVSTTASQLADQSLSVWGLHVLRVPVWLSSHSSKPCSKIKCLLCSFLCLQPYDSLVACPVCTLSPFPEVNWDWLQLPCNSDEQVLFCTGYTDGCCRCIKKPNNKFQYLHSLKKSWLTLKSQSVMQQPTCRTAMSLHTWSVNKNSNLEQKVCKSEARLVKAKRNATITHKTTLYHYGEQKGISERTC